MKITMPLRMQVGRKKYTLSLNVYRNLHYQVANKLKKLYKEEVKYRLSSLWKIELEPPISLVLIYYNWTKRESDLENFCTIQAKFFQDAIVELWYLPDDNYKYITELRFVYGGYDQGNGRVEISILQ